MSAGALKAHKFTFVDLHDLEKKFNSLRVVKWRMAIITALAAAELDIPYTVLGNGHVVVGIKDIPKEKAAEWERASIEAFKFFEEAIEKIEQTPRGESMPY